MSHSRVPPNPYSLSFGHPPSTDMISPAAETPGSSSKRFHHAHHHPGHLKPAAPPKPPHKSKSSKKNHTEEPFQVFTIPRVELYCKDPKCPYNSQNLSSPSSEASSCHGPTPWNSTELSAHYPPPPPTAGAVGSHRSKSDDTRTTTMASTSSGRSSSVKYDSVFDPSHSNSSRQSRPLPPTSIAINPAQKRLPPIPTDLNTSKTTSVQTSPMECPNGITKHARFTPVEKCAACQYSPLAQFPNCVCRLNGSKISEMDLVNPFWRFENRHTYLSGGFTLNGGDQGRKSDGRVKRFCSSHKIALVVSTFSLIVTIGLVITLLLMKNKGMMEPM